MCLADGGDTPALPTSIWSGSFRVYGVDVKCHVLDDGQRVIEADSVAALFEAMGTPGVEMGDVEEFVRWQRS